MKLIAARGASLKIGKRKRNASSRIRPVATDIRSRVAHAYRGYRVTHNATHGIWNVSKDGSHIYAAPSLAQAYAGIDAIVGPMRNPKKDTRVRKRAAVAKRLRNPSPYRYKVSVGGTHLARFLTLMHAKQYAQALANKMGRQVRVTA